MGGLYEQFKTDKGIEKEGVILEYGKNSKGESIRIRIARAGGANQRFAKVLERKTKPYRRQLQTETLDEEIGNQINREVYAESVVLGWEGVEDEKGVAMPFTKENCVKLFTDLPDLFADVREQAGKVAIFRQDVLEGEAKN